MATNLSSLINQLSHLVEVLRECDRGDEAENLECLIERLKIDK